MLRAKYQFAICLQDWSSAQPLLTSARAKALHDVFGPEHEEGGFENLDIAYAVRPSSVWTTLKPYRNFIGKHALPYHHSMVVYQHCVCRQYYNPDKTMCGCPHEGCGTWNHEECLMDAILDKDV